MFSKFISKWVCVVILLLIFSGSVVDALTTFSAVVSGNCNYVSRRSIPDKAMCEKALTTLGLSVSDDGRGNPRDIAVMQTPYYPPGCFIIKTRDGKTSLIFNTFVFTNTVVDRCSTEFRCLCVTAPVCTWTHGVTANDAACACGSVACSTDSGLHCYESSNKCRTFPPCTQTDGVTANDAACECGSASCSTDSGLHCYEAGNLCQTSKISVCSQTGMVTANDAACECGTASCSTTSGLHCYKSTNNITTEQQGTCHPAPTACAPEPVSLSSFCSSFSCSFKKHYTSPHLTLFDSPFST